MKTLSVMLILAVVLPGCTRHRPSEKPPIHLNQNMDDQPKYKTQAASRFFADGAAMRMPIEGTVARGQLHEENVYYTGKNKSGKPIQKSPVPVTMQLLKRGRERFDIYCSPCHGRTGDGQGIVVKRGMLPPPSFYEPRLMKAADGHFFDVITNGIRNMPPYRYQVPVSDRWAIVTYLRALQLSRHATKDEVPPALR